MKKWLAVIATVVLIVSIASLTGCGREGEGNIAQSQQTGIWVTGEGKVSVTPDVATIQLGIQTQASTVTDAQQQASNAMNKVMSALTTNGVASKDIQTSYFNIQKLTRYDQTKQQDFTIGYQVTNMVTAKIRDISKVGGTIDAVAQAGGDATQVNNISFSVDNPLPYYDQARQKAMAVAKDKASNLATLAGVKLGKPTFINESGANVMPPSPIYAKGAALDMASTPISAGSTDITMTIQLVYNIQ